MLAAFVAAVADGDAVPPIKECWRQDSVRRWRRDPETQQVSPPFCILRKCGGSAPEPAGDAKSVAQLVVDIARLWRFIVWEEEAHRVVFVLRACVQHGEVAEQLDVSRLQHVI